ncbi:MAG: flagellar biosynthesis anti-sigma factor FlgM [Myxococcota bacterium]
MKVDRAQGTIVLETYRQQRQRAEVASEKAERGEKVELSSEARKLEEMRASEKPDAERIERLKEAIRNGTFQIDAERIAQTMLDEER